MLTYNPEKFASLYATPVGQRFWAFLIEDATIARLETASELGRPALEGVEEQLLEEFQGEALVDRNKQMIGHMTRQIMEQRGWVLDQSEVKVQSVPFIKASRYKRPDWSTFHVFRNASDPRDLVITDRRQGASLPADARWTYYVTFASPLKAAVAFGVGDLDQLAREVRTKGCHRLRQDRMVRRAS
jgi:hypothetical protein